VVTGPPFPGVVPAARRPAPNSPPVRKCARPALGFRLLPRPGGPVGRPFSPAPCGPAPQLGPPRAAHESTTGAVVWSAGAGRRYHLSRRPCAPISSMILFAGYSSSWVAAGSEEIRSSKKRLDPPPARPWPPSRSSVGSCPGFGRDLAVPSRPGGHPSSVSSGGQDEGRPCPWPAGRPVTACPRTRSGPRATLPPSLFICLGQKALRLGFARVPQAPNVVQAPRSRNGSRCRPCSTNLLRC